MKRKIILIILTILAVISFTAFGCSNCSEGEQQSTPTLTLNTNDLKLCIDESVQLTVKSDNGAEYVVDWKSENTDVATVDQSGNVVAQKIGVTNIVATVEGFEPLICKVVVSFEDELPILVFENEQSEYVLGMGETALPFTPYVYYNNVKYYDVETKYVSSDEEILTVTDDKGSINIKKTGNVTISVTVQWRNVTLDVSPLLQKNVNVEIKDSVFFFVNGRQHNEFNLYTVSSFYNQSYVNSVEFAPSVQFNGVAHGDEDVVVEYNDQALSYDQENDILTAHLAGTEKVILKYTEGDKIYTSSVVVKIARPEATYERKINYFSSLTGTFKDETDGFADKTLTSLIFGEDDVDGIKAFQDDKELTIENGKIKGVKENYKGVYETVIKLQSNKYVYNVEASVASLFIQNKDDLKNFELKFTAQDNPETYGVDETRYTYIEGYCELLNNIDAEGLVLEHDALLPHTFVYDENTTITDTGFNRLFWSYNNCNKTYGSVVSKFGFLGKFNGNGYTIFNLDTSNESNNKGGLFGYLLGGAVIENVGFSNLNITSSAGLANGNYNPKYHRYNPATSIVDALGVRTTNAVFSNIYVSLSSETANPQGVLLNFCNGYQEGYYEISNVIVDGTQVNTNLSTKNAINLIKDPTSLYAVGQAIRSDIYVISNFDYLSNSSAQNDASRYLVRGENEANGKELNTRYEETETIYASGIKTYETFAEMALADNDYESFNEFWQINNYPIFKNNQEVVVLIDDEPAIENVLYLSSTETAKSLALIDLHQRNISIGGIDYDDTLFVVSNNSIKLKNLAQTVQETTISINFTYKGGSKSITVDVIIVPEKIVVSERAELSQYSGDLTELINLPEPILTLTQQFDGARLINITILDGKAIDLVVKVKADRSGVERSTIVITTKTFKYEFTNVYVYSHVISKATDFNVFARRKNKLADDGYYVMANNVDMLETGVSHSDVTNDNNENVFKGIFDGRGYAIINFKPTDCGMFGKLYADSDNQAVIKNVAFTSVQSKKGSNFSILARFIGAANGSRITIENVHVQIANTYKSSDDRPTANYQGLVYCNSTTNYDTFLMKNVYITIANEEYTPWVRGVSGTVFGRDDAVVKNNVSLTNRSNRFDNVITVTKQNPIVCKMPNGQNKEPTTFGFNGDGSRMYFMYSETDIGKKGLTYDNEHYHENIQENPSAGSYILENVYRYDRIAEVDGAKLNKLSATSYWIVRDGVLYWKSITKFEPAKTEDNFNIGFLER